MAWPGRGQRHRRSPERVSVRGNGVSACEQADDKLPGQDRYLLIRHVLKTFSQGKR